MMRLSAIKRKGIVLLQGRCAVARPGFRLVDNNTFKALMASNLSRGGIYSVLVVIHETIGFQRYDAKIPMSKFLWHTRLKKGVIRRGIKEAEARKIIIVRRDSTRPTMYAVNDFREWQTSTKNESSELVPEMNLNLVQKQTQTRSTATNKNNSIKETFKETFKETTPPDKLSLDGSLSPHPSKKEVTTTPQMSLLESSLPHPFPGKKD